MPRFFTPNFMYKPGAGNDISPDVLCDLYNKLPPESIICVGFTAANREVDIAIFTSVAVHVIESKDYYRFPVHFFKNQGLHVRNESGAWEPIINDRGLGEYSNIQAAKNAGAVHWECKENGYPLSTYSYILVPHPAPGSDVSENGDKTRICLGVDDLIKSIHNREELIVKKGRSNGLSESTFVDIAKRVFRLNETDTINGYRFGDPPPVFKVETRPQSRNESAFNMGRSIRQMFNWYPPSVSKLVMICSAVILLIVLSSFLSSQKACVLGGNLNVRNAPGMQGEIVDTLDSRTCFFVDGKSEDGAWVRISGSKNNGNWVSSAFIRGVDVQDLKIVR